MTQCRFRIWALVAWFAAAAQAVGASRYWEWGWGTYGSLEPLDVARFDWSLINFGNVGATPETVERCNTILALNPRHRFVVRVWPIMGKGDCAENHQQATLFHYLYQPGVRDQVLAETQRQLRLVIEGVATPASVVGATFLEELPGHFTSSPWGSWRAGDPLPWDIRRFEKEIAAELGEPFDMANEAHRRWWGRKYAGALAEIHAAMKKAGDGRLVLYWQATGWNLLDHLEPGQSLLTPGIVPVSYADILRPALCDGLFGYPNNDVVWRRQTQSIVEKYACLFFSQTSTPAGMRLAPFADTVRLARWENPGNLGTFFFIQGGRAGKAWNELPWLANDRCWLQGEVARRIAWDHRIGLDTVERCLSPRVQLDYDGTGKRQGDFVHVYGQVENPRHPSWYGGDPASAVLKDVTVSLAVPDGFSIPPDRSPPATLALGDLAAGSCKAGDWWVRVDGDGTLPPGHGFRLTARAGDGPAQETTVTALRATVPALQGHPIVRSGDCWIEPAYQLPAFLAALEMVPRVDVVFPEVRSGGQAVLYRDVLTADTRLVVGPGHRATLYPKPLLADDVRRLSGHLGPDGLAVFADGYAVYATPRVAVRPATRYRLQLCGKVGDGGILHAMVFFAGRKDGKPLTQDVSCLYNQFGADLKTVEQVVASPATDPGSSTAIVRVYRHKSQGTLYLQSLDFALADQPAAGTDVTARIEGVLPQLTAPFTEWVYQDRSDPDPNGTPKLVVRFLKP